MVLQTGRKLIKPFPPDLLPPREEEADRLSVCSAPGGVGIMKRGYSR
jgi:hypothetical protein